MKKTLSFLFLFVSLITYSQQYTVPISLCDSIAPHQYRYRLNGYGAFNESMILHIELLNSSNGSVPFRKEHNFADTAVSTSPAFTYDPYTKSYSIELGIFNKPDFLLHMWIIAEGGIKQEEIYYKQ